MTLFDPERPKSFDFRKKLRQNLGVNLSVSIVIPCLNEEECIQSCIEQARKAFPESSTEVLVVDNGSSDRSVELAEAAGARVISEKRRGYGSAILRGLQEARGDFLVIGDADNTYDFSDARPLVEALREGADFAIGNRLAGQIEDGAMPWLHRHLGTPVLTGILNIFYGTRVRDINCGLRAIRKSRIKDLRLRSPGMEFASEMVIHARKSGLKIVEKPIKYRRRGGGEAKLRTLRDGWRHLRFILLFAPFYLYLLPALWGAAVSLWLFQSPRLGFQTAGVLLSLMSYQVFLFGLLAKSFLWTSDSFVVDRRLGRWIDHFRLEYGILVALGFAGIGAGFLLQFDILNLIRGTAFLSIGVQTFFSSFLLSAILHKRPNSEV
jgi:glycosyltransferase involved in cell wall biosynthesis